MYQFLLISKVISIIILQVSSQTNFTVFTEECKIPYFPESSKEANIIYQDYQSCADSKPLTFTRVVKNKAYLHLQLENEILHKSQIPLTCCYSYVTRNGTEEEPDIGISISDCVYFNTTIELEDEIVMVKCHKDSVLVYENVHSPITITEAVQTKLEKKPIESPLIRPISVLFIVIDSLSRLNFKRTMPATRKYLLNNGFVEFIAYNKVDDNTFPNCMALLSGMNLRQVYSKCNPKEVGKLDECPMIWYRLRELGYVTAYAEDWADYATFNYLIKGFKDPPTDYYFKPYMEAAETLNVVTKDGLPYCTGPETEGQRILNLARDFAVTFKGKPSFGIFWMNTFSHNNISSPTVMDEKVASFFRDLRRNGILQESVVVLLSDHGIRFGNFRQTIQGWFEERLPISAISLPTWFQRKFEEKYENFLNNTDKLISTYDLYMTLQDILTMSVPEYNINSSLACPECRSLFSNITDNRSCREAGIPEAWCTCVGEFTTEDPRLTEETIKRAAELALTEIKRMEYEEPFSTSVENILSSSVNLNRLRKSYLLLVLETNTNVIYQFLFRIRGDPVQFVRIVKTMRL